MHWTTMPTMASPIDVDNDIGLEDPAHCHDLPSRHFGIHPTSSSTTG